MLGPQITSALGQLMGRACACVKRGHSLGFSGLLISRAESTDLFIFGKISLFNFTRGFQSPIIRKTSLNLNRFMIRLPVFLEPKISIFEKSSDQYTVSKTERKQEQKDLLNLPLSRAMNCYSSQCSGLVTTSPHH